MKLGKLRAELWTPLVQPKKTKLQTSLISPKKTVLSLLQDKTRTLAKYESVFLNKIKTLIYPVVVELITHHDTCCLLPPSSTAGSFVGCLASAPELSLLQIQYILQKKAEFEAAASTTSSLSNRDCPGHRAALASGDLAQYQHNHEAFLVVDCRANTALYSHIHVAVFIYLL